MLIISGGTMIGNNLFTTCQSLPIPLLDYNPPNSIIDKLRGHNFCIIILWKEIQQYPTIYIYVAVSVLLLHEQKMYAINISLCIVSSHISMPLLFPCPM
jgi:hypothetical protein